MPFELELTAALEAAYLAGERIMRDYAALDAVADAPVTVSTETDRASQEIILTHLHKAFPSDMLCAEEATETLANTPTHGSRQWIVDPIDGTRGFVTKNGEFSVMIALRICDDLTVGVVYEPVQGRMTYATQGGGCFVQLGDAPATRVKVTTTIDLGSATLVQSHHRAPEGSPVVRALSPRKIVETYSAGVKLAIVARGEGDLYVNTYSKFHDWDIAAGHLLVTEAGGSVTELNGNPIRYGQPKYAQRGGLLATNGAIHPNALRKLADAEVVV